MALACLPDKLKLKLRPLSVFLVVVLPPRRPLSLFPSALRLQSSQGEPPRG